MELTLLAVVVFKPTACARYPTELYNPISIPANPALSLVGSSHSLDKTSPFVPLPCFNSASIGAKSRGSMASAAKPNLSVLAIPTDMPSISSMDFTIVKFVPYSAAERRRRSLAFQTSLRMDIIGVDGG